MWCGLSAQSKGFHKPHHTHLNISWLHPDSMCVHLCDHVADCSLCVSALGVVQRTPCDTSGGLVNPGGGAFLSDRMQSGSWLAWVCHSDANGCGCVRPRMQLHA